jgi:two-component system, chemotaxis family, sensor kinase CheA
MADDRFLQMFFEEARELLLSLEEGLMDLERRQSDRAHLDRTFRAAHSIKGAAAMVGLGAIAEFTHLIEAVLDRIRSGSLPVDSDVISTLLDGRDHLATAVEAEASRSPVPAPSELVRRLSALLRDPSAPAPTPPPARPSKAPSSPAPFEPPGPSTEPTSSAASPSSKAKAPKKSPGEAKSKARGPRGSKKTFPQATPGVESAGGVGSYRITLKPGPELLRRGVNPLGVLDELREFGPTKVSTDPDLVPPLEEMDPERCYLAWTIEVATDVPPDRLDDVFLFVAEDSTVTIERRSSEGAVLPPPTVESPEIPPAPVAAPAPPPVAVVPEPSILTKTNGTVTPPTPAAKPAAPTSASTTPRMSTRIRVDAGQLDDLVGLAGELAVLSDNLQGVRDQSAAAPWIATLEALDRVSRLIRDTTLELRMVPVEELFSRFPRVVRDLADRFGKEIELRIIGQETRLDRTIVERLSDPMIHLIRNAVDHALETPAERIAAGKPRMGRITLWAGHEGDRVALRIEDDGRGLDRVGIVKKGIAKGLVPVGTSPDDPRVDTLIFEPGFSTRDAVSELSGRGVGLDVVRDAVRSLRGSLGVESHPGKGTSFIFRLPLTLALIDGLLVETGGGRYVVPLAQVEECVALNGASPALSRGRPCVSIRGELVPLVQLREVFHAEGQRPARQELLLTRHAGNRFSGATILGDGSVSLILDLAALVSESRAADSHTYHTLPPGVTSEAYR